ncbi:FHA domain-containing protein [Calothrix sp. 336/3]|uniref:FHA domain-containing protein n=1 Tax=Calothrix sp. 336/3 TaxID=1337936 RepID=UPI0004E46DD1|nr:FHA domain-containing protein [Calothrix sp. 336/3]AKG23345.1 hypothetical protein IJ00_20520 [Calothrix sp. 336/3]
MNQISQLQTREMNIELFHLQSQTYFPIPHHLSVARIGKSEGDNIPEIDVTHLPNAEIVSRCHAEIHLQDDKYYLQDVGSINGTYLNQKKLESHTLYPIKLQDIISLGKDEQFILIVQKQHQKNLPLVTSPTTLQPQVISSEKVSVNSVSRTSKLLGIGLMVTGLVIFAANTQVGIFVQIPAFVLCIAGAFILLQRKIEPAIGWFLITLGILWMIFSGHLFASVNLLSLILSGGLFLGGCQIFTTGKILKYDLQTIKKIIGKG